MVTYENYLVKTITLTLDLTHLFTYTKKNKSHNNLCLLDISKTTDGTSNCGSSCCTIKRNKTKLENEKLHDKNTKTQNSRD